MGTTGTVPGTALDLVKFGIQINDKLQNNNLDISKNLKDVLDINGIVTYEVSDRKNFFAKKKCYVGMVACYVQNGDSHDLLRLTNAIAELATDSKLTRSTASDVACFKLQVAC